MAKTDAETLIYEENVMVQQEFRIEGIPAILWGSQSDKLFVAIHGNMSNKADDAIDLFAGEAYGEHYFHTKEQLQFFGQWLKEQIG